MTKKEKALYLLKRYGYLLVLGACALAIIIAVVASSNKKTPITNGGVEEVGASVISMNLPVLNATVTKSFNNTALQYNETLEQYEAHLGMDFVASAGSSVYSVLAGKVTEVGNNYLKGNYVVIEHENGLKSVYSSLSDEVKVSKGDSVEKGDVIGTVGSSAYSELEEGNHLHFELLDNDKKIDPAGYLNIENK